MIGLLQENGPCSVNRDSNSTTLNPWSWNQNVNMLYIGKFLQSLSPAANSSQISLYKLASVTTSS